MDAEVINDMSPTEMTDEQLDAQLNPPEVKEEPVEEPKEELETPKEEPKEEPVEPEPPKEEPFSVSKEEWDKLQKRLDEKEKFINRQADEVGKRRKSEEQLRQEVFNLRTQLSGENVNHVEAMDIQNAIREREAQLDEAEIRTITEFNRNTVKSFVAEPESLMDEMIELAKEDGQTDESIRAFRDNIYREPPGTLINLAKRAEMRKEMRNKDAIIASKDAEIASLKAELETVRGKPKEVLKNIERALREPAQMTNKSGQASSTKETIEPSQIPHMTDEELERAIRESS